MPFNKNGRGSFLLLDSGGLLSIAIHFIAPFQGPAGSNQVKPLGRVATARRHILEPISLTNLPRRSCINEDVQKAFISVNLGQPWSPLNFL